MKKILVLLCLGFLIMKAGSSHADSSVEPDHINFAKSGMLVVETGGSHRAFFSQQLTALLEHGKIPSASGEMMIILSPQEFMVFRKRDPVSYFCGEEADLKCRADIKEAQVTSLSGIIDHDGMPQKYFAKFYSLKTGTNKLPPYNLLSIDGIPVSLTYKNGGFLIARGH